jgi:hypothetical protein
MRLQVFPPEPVVVVYAPKDQPPAEKDCALVRRFYVIRKGSLGLPYEKAFQCYGFTGKIRFSNIQLLDDE